MSLRPLVIGPEEKQRIAHLADFASDRNHWFYPTISDWVPGDMPEYTLEIWTYRCVFTWSVMGKVVGRQLSVSVPAEGKFPNAAAVLMLATEFGLTGWDGEALSPPGDWAVHVEQEAPIPYVVMAQPIEGVTP